MFGCGYVLLDIWWIYLVGLLDMLVLHGLYSLKVGASQNTCLCLVTDNFLSRVLHEVNNRNISLSFKDISRGLRSSPNMNIWLDW